MEFCLDDTILDEIEAYVSGKRSDDHMEAVLEKFSLDEIYKLQSALFSRMSRDKSERIFYKLSIINCHSQKLLGIDRPIYGVVPGSRVLSSGAILPLPRGNVLFEAEFAVTIGRGIDASSSRRDVMASVAGIFPAIEIIENVPPGSAPLPSPRLLAACGKSEGCFVLGDLLAASKPGTILPSAATTEIRVLADGLLHSAGHHLPGIDLIDLLSMLASDLDRNGTSLRAGDVVMTGAIIRPFTLPATTTSLAVDAGHLGSVHIRFG